MEAAAEQLEVVRGDRNAPIAISGRIQRLKSSATATPSAHAEATEATASTTSSQAGIAVPSGLPASSSSAWAPMPTARKNASTVSPSRPHDTSAARQPPTTT